MINTPLTINIKDEKLTIEIGLNILKYASFMSMSNWDHNIKEYTAPKIIDVKAFAADIVNELGCEEEDGTTIVHEMLDKAMVQAYENGSLGWHETEMIREAVIMKKMGIINNIDDCKDQIDD